MANLHVLDCCIALGLDIHDNSLVFVVLEFKFETSVSCLVSVLLFKFGVVYCEFIKL